LAAGLSPTLSSALGVSNEVMAGGAIRRYSRRDWSTARLSPRLLGAIEPRPWAGQLELGQDNLAKQCRGQQPPCESESLISKERLRNIELLLRAPLTQSDLVPELGQEMAAHESPRTTKFYHRTKERLTQGEVERIRL
jgi:hypothetical protein